MHTRTLFGSAFMVATLLLTACGAAQPATGGAVSTPAATAAGGMAGMDHSTMPMGTATTSAPYDAQFIDSMIMHHQGAITMANDALKQAERPEVKALAANIIKAQAAEIAQMQAWRKQWYPELAATGGMGTAMGEMTVGGDASTPFDQRFIMAMIPHHQSAVTMAQDAQQKAEHPEIKALAGTIITDQEKEIAQMQQWLTSWYAK